MSDLALHLLDATAREPSPCFGAPRQGQHQWQRVKVGEPLSGKSALVKNEAVDRLPGNGRSTCPTANRELDQNAIGGGAPAVNLDSHVGYQLEKVGEGALSCLQPVRGRDHRRGEASIGRQDCVEALGHRCLPELHETPHEVGRSILVHSPQLSLESKSGRGERVACL